MESNVQPFGAPDNTLGVTQLTLTHTDFGSFHVGADTSDRPLVLDAASEQQGYMKQVLHHELTTKKHPPF